MTTLLINPSHGVAFIPILSDTRNNLALPHKPIEHLSTDLIVELGSNGKHECVGSHHVFLMEHCSFFKVFGMAFNSVIDGIPIKDLKFVRFRLIKQPL